MSMTTYDFSAPALVVAPRLLGWRLRCGEVCGIIAELEAYQGCDDKACHAHKGRTPRTEVLFAAPGTLYCYLCYGMHSLLNIVCDAVDTPAAVLIRGLRITKGEAIVRQRRGLPRGPVDRLANGPGKVCQALGVDTRIHGQPLIESPLQLEPPETPAVADQIAVGARVGVAYAGPEWSAMPWRWWFKGFPVAAGDRR